MRVLRAGEEGAGPDVRSGPAGWLFCGVEDEDGGDGIERLGGEIDVERVALLGELEGLVGGVAEQVGSGDLARHLVYVEVTLPVEDFDVDLVAFGGGAPLPGGGEFGFAVVAFLGGGEGSGGSVEDCGAGSVDSLAVDLHPFAHVVKAVNLGLRDNAFGVGADVEEIVASFGGNVDEVADEGLRRLEVGVEGFVSPGVVDGHAGLPVAAGVALGGDVLLGGFSVTLVGSTEPIVPDEVGVLVEELDDFSGALGGHGLGGGVEPDDDGVVLVVGQELFDLGDGLLVEVVVKGAILGFIPVAGLLIVIAADGCGSSGGGPVLRLGVVEAELDSLLAALLGELLEGIAMEGSGGDDVEGIDLGVEHGEAVVMLGGNDDVLHAGSLGEGNDVMRGEAGGVELLCEAFVVGDGDGEIVHDPLTDVGGALTVPLACGDGVEAPVDEHAEAGLAPPGHASVALRGGFGVLDCRDRMICGGGVGFAALELGKAERCRGGEEESGCDAAMQKIHGRSFGLIFTAREL